MQDILISKGISTTRSPDINQHFNNQELQPSNSVKLMSRLGELENQCGELCDLKKPVLVENVEFMGTVKAKVVISMSIFGCHLFGNSPVLSLSLNDIQGKLFGSVQSGNDVSCTR